MLYRNLIAAHRIVPSGLSRVQNHVLLKLIESHNSFADGNLFVHLLMLGNSLAGQTLFLNVRLSEYKRKSGLALETSFEMVR